ncbi:hypothetical protein ES703_75291 [subsurface metagenome]
MALINEILQWLILTILTGEQLWLCLYWRKHGTDRYRRRYN